MKKPIIKKIIIQILLIAFLLITLLLSQRGLSGNPSEKELNSFKWIEDGPFELSPERGRFALTYSLINNRSFQFSDSLGLFAMPDVAVSNGRHVSLFAPLLSFLVIPGYIVGRFFGAAQVGTFAVISVFAIFNFFLIKAIAIRLKANRIAATLGAIVFLFATPAFTYAINLYQHHISTFLILLSIWILMKSTKAWTLILVFFLCALSIPLDYPNLILMLPIGLLALARIFSFEKIKNKLSIKVNLKKFFTLLIVFVPILFFLWFNQMSYGNPFQLSGTLPRAKELKLTENKKDYASILQPGLKYESKKNAIKYFETRNILNGLYLHFISPDRGIIYYTPVILLGILGLFTASKRKIKAVPIFVAIIGVNVLLYSMWGDPWGGWAFGSRYLIPSYAILSIFIALLLTYWRKNILFLAIFIILFSYSSAVNALGAITTSAMPPQIEVLSLEKLSGRVEPYTYKRNWDYLRDGDAKAFIFRTFGRGRLSTTQYYGILAGLIIFTGLSLTVILRLREEKTNE
jgi:hypothetical protein